MSFTFEWDGNVRELENAIERAVVMASASVLTPENLPTAVRQVQGIPFKGQQIEPFQGISLYEYEKQLILKTLLATEWNKYQTAKLLGITRSTLYSKIKKYKLTPSD
jgi:DNA-binding NtrC family response regulator